MRGSYSELIFSFYEKSNNISFALDFSDAGDFLVFFPLQNVGLGKRKFVKNQYILDVA